MPLVGATRLTELGLVSGYVEDVIDDLEDDAELGREAPERHCGRSGDTGQWKHRCDGCSDERSGLQLVQAAQLYRVRAGDVEELAADHARHARRVDDLAEGR